MNKLAALMKLIRWPNLLMLALVQFISYYVFVDIIPIKYLALISLATIFIAAGGNLINDYFDYDLDIANGKSPFFAKSSIGNLSFIYSIIGLIIGFYLSFISEYQVFLFFLLAFIILWSYALFFSKYKIIGNILISLLIAEAIFIVPLFSLFNQFNLKSFFNPEVIDYMWLAFLFNWIREIIKDLEDQKGDAAFGRKTFPLLIGEFNTKIVVVLILIATNIFLYQSYFGNLLVVILPIAISSILLMFGLINAHNPKEFKRASLLVKLMMLFGVLSPFFL